MAIRSTTDVSITTTTSTVQAPSQSVDLKMASIRARVLQTIRNYMPLTTLFTHQLKIDLGVFIKDQMLIHRIAEFIAPLQSTDMASIAKHFEGSELLTELKDMFKEDLYLVSIYEACSDVLSKKPCSNMLKSAIEGRIFTLKNALIAKHNPVLVRKSQVQYQISSHSIPDIEKEGASFIRESLRLHLTALQETDNTSFRKCLTSAAEQLIPFVERITGGVLMENGYPPEPLTFRNPTGYNYQGFVAAIVMEVCLNALGCKTRVMRRCDLEPRVTLATTHSIVEVTSPDDLRYIIDPCYLQFHKDIGVEEKLLPTATVLVLEENEVDDYIEKNIMMHWKANAQRFSKSDPSFMDKITTQDLMSFRFLNYNNVPKELIPSGVEDFVRRAFKRVWGLSTYSSTRFVEGCQDIFNGLKENSIVYKTTKPMGIFPLTHHLSYPDVGRQLEPFMSNPALKGQNALEALALLSQLPYLKRAKYKCLLDLDPRTHTDVGLDVYFRSLKKVVNPQEKDLKVVYGCSGADCMSVLLATDAKELLFVDLTKISFSEFKEALTLLKSSSKSQIKERLGKDYFIGRETYMAGMSGYGDGQHHMDDLALKLLFDLQETGVDLDQVDLTSINGEVRIDFSWQYYGAPSARKRSVTFITADITKPDAYPDHLQSQLKAGIDIFYLKGAFFAPQSYPQFLPTLAKHMNAGGWLMTTDKTSFMETVNPEFCLKQNNLHFSLHKSEEIHLLEELISPSSSPFAVVQTLRMFPPEKRLQRSPGTDITYWAILNLRQKI